MARAYAYAEGDGPEPRELEILRLIDRFGVEAIMGRPLGVGETRRMLTAERVVLAYQARTASENWAEWAHENQALNELLGLAMRAANAETG